MPDFDFAVLGAGAMGSILGGHLARAGHSVVMLARDPYFKGRPLLVGTHGSPLRERRVLSQLMEPGLRSILPMSAI